MKALKREKGEEVSSDEEFLEEEEEEEEEELEEEIGGRHSTSRKLQKGEEGYRSEDDNKSLGL